MYTSQHTRPTPVDLKLHAGWFPTSDTAEFGADLARKRPSVSSNFEETSSALHGVLGT